MESVDVWSGKEEADRQEEEDRQALEDLVAVTTPSVLRRIWSWVA